MWPLKNVMTNSFSPSLLPTPCVLCWLLANRIVMVWSIIFLCTWRLPLSVILICLKLMRMNSRSVASWHLWGILFGQSRKVDTHSFRLIWHSLFCSLILTGVCPTTVNTEANAPKRGTASRALATERDTVEPRATTVSESWTAFRLSKYWAWSNQSQRLY